MFRELYEKFNDTNIHYQSKIEELYKERRELEQKLINEKEAYERMVLKEVESSRKRNQSDASMMMRKGVEEIEKQIKDMDYRIELIQQTKVAKLKKMLSEMKKAHDLAVKESSNEIEKRKVEALERRCQYLLFIRNLNEPYQAARDIHSQFINAAHIAGVSDYDRESISMPTLNLTGQYGQTHEHLAPLQHEILEAYRLGRVPFFVKLYALTGELLSEGEARNKIEQMRREATINE